MVTLIHAKKKRIQHKKRLQILLYNVIRLGYIIQFMKLHYDSFLQLKQLFGWVARLNVINVYDKTEQRRATACKPTTLVSVLTHCRQVWQSKVYGHQVCLDHHDISQ